MKPVCKLTGQDGNIFNLLGLAIKALRKAGQAEQVEEMTQRVHKSESYDEALRVIMDYVEAE